MGCAKPSVLELPLKPQSLPPPKPKKLPTRRSDLHTSRISSITEKYQILSALGSDSTGSLFAASELLSGSIRTLRDINKLTLAKGLEIFSEFKVLKELDHPNIIKFFEAFETSKSIYIAMENISGGRLVNRVTKLISENEKVRYVYELFTALNYLHKEGFIHCNICAETVLLSTEDSTSIVKIIGFNNSVKLLGPQNIDFSKLDQNFASPEITKGQVSEKTDVWSAGVLLYRIFTGRSLLNQGSFFDLNSKETGKKLLNSGFASLSEQEKDLIQQMLKINPLERPSFEELLNHGWLKTTKEKKQLSLNLVNGLSGFKIKNHIGRCLLRVISEKNMTSQKDFDLVQCFRALDVNNDGKVSKGEILMVFNELGVNLTNRIDLIMENLDYDLNGFVDFSELVLALTNWSQEIKKKNIRKTFVNKEGVVCVKDLLNDLPQTIPEELNELLTECKAENGFIQISELKSYLKKLLV